MTSKVERERHIDNDVNMHEKVFNSKSKSVNLNISFLYLWFSLYLNMRMVCLVLSLRCPLQSLLRLYLRKYPNHCDRKLSEQYDIAKIKKAVS